MALSILFDEEWLAKAEGREPPAPKSKRSRKKKRGKRGRRPSRHKTKTKYVKQSLVPLVKSENE